jgi:small multidrug resistance pump
MNPRTMKIILLIAAVYNIIWGGFVVVFPLAAFEWAGMEPPRYPQIWQCVGMVVGVYGVGYAIAARDPLRHWPIILVGFLGKILGPIGFFFYAMNGEIPWIWIWVILSNDLIWWFPFGAILLNAFQAETQEGQK